MVSWMLQRVKHFIIDQVVRISSAFVYSQNPVAKKKTDFGWPYQNGEETDCQSYAIIGTSFIAVQPISTRKLQGKLNQPW